MGKDFVDLVELQEDARVFTPEKTLWACVLVQAIEDLHRGKVWDYIDAEAWFLRGRGKEINNFYQVCQNTGFDPGAVMAKVRPLLGRVVWIRKRQRVFDWVKGKYFWTVLRTPTLRPMTEQQWEVVDGMRGVR